MKKKYWFAIVSILIFNYTYSQWMPKSNLQRGTNSTLNNKWKTSPFDHQVFIENKGQFDGNIPGNYKILYGAQLGDVMAYFTLHGIVYCYAELPKREESISDKDHDEDEHVKPVIHYVSSNWENASPSVVIEANNKQSSYYTYSIPNPQMGDKGGNGTIKTDIFKGIVYKNIYPGIDIGYGFPKGKDGLEYSITVHPGADISKVKLLYATIGETPRVLKLDINTGDVIFNSGIGEITEHSPIGYYEGEAGNINVSYKINGSTESFSIGGSYDKSKTLVIDPWVSDPNFLNYDRAYDICYDYNGNVYAFGGQAQYQLAKFNSAGVLLWTYTTNPFNGNFGYYGDFAVDRKTGTSYVTSGFWWTGAQVLKVNTLGNVTATYNGQSNLNEMWRASYNPCYDNIVIGAGGTTDTNQACMLDTNLVTITPINFLHIRATDHDVALTCVDPSGLYSYMATCTTGGNLFVQLPLPNLNPATYIKQDHFSLPESNVAKYISNNLDASGAMNGIAASPNWLYLYDGKSLKQYYKNTGIMHDSIAVSNTAMNWGGIDVDACDDIFLGCRDSVKYYDGSLSLKGSITMPGTVYCLTLGQDNLLYVGGSGFVTQVDVPAPAKLISSAGGSPSSCQACNGSATVTVNCGVPPFAFLWSNGSTNQTDTGLCAGLYTVTVTDGSCPPRYDTAIVSISGKAGYAASVVDTNPGCQFNRGYIKVFPYGGTAPYTYSWSNGATTQQISGLTAGTYICTITDDAGCKYEQDVLLINASPVTVNVVPVNDTICPGTPVSITASGTDKYSWTPHVGLSCYNCANPTATTLVNVTYTVVGSDTLGCQNTATVTIKVLAAPKPVIKGRSPVCTGFSDTLIAKGGTSYTWSNGATTDTIIVAATNETLTVTATNGICSHDTTFTIVTDLPNAVITVIYDSVCSKAPDTLTASGGDAYIWEPGGRTSPLIVVTPSITTTYTLSATDNQGGCVSTASVTISIIKNIASTVHLSQDSICQGTQTSLDITTSGNVVLSYTWSTGATTTVITVTPNADTTFYVIADGKCNKDSVAKKVNVIPLPIPVIALLDSVCKGSNDTLTVSGGTEYLWSNGSTKTTYIIKDIKADSSITVIAYNYRDKKCKVSETVNIPEKPLPSVTAKGATICAGECITLKATPSGGGYYTFSWSNGAMIDSTMVCPTTDTAYYVTVFNGCKSPRGAAEIQVFPQSLLVCCDTTIKEYASSNTTVSASGKYQGDTAILTANKGKSYVWTPSSSLNCDTCQTVIATPTVTTTYTVNAIDSNGCTDVTTVTVKVEFPCFDFNVPNVFTPNNDNINDYFLVKTENLDGYSITIYDRWGKQVFNSNNPSQPWDGNTEGGSKAADGVYYWIITTNCQGSNTRKDGFVQLIR